MYLLVYWCYSRPDIPLLLALYESVHLNRNFVLALKTSHAGSNRGSSHSLVADTTEELPPAIPRASDGADELANNSI